jgi:ABC-type antimicrobial peptide transport system permease subunit
MYLPLRQAPPAGNVQAVVRTRGSPDLLTTAAHAALRSVDPLLPATDVGTMEEAVAKGSLGLTYLASLIGIGGGIAFVMAVVGIYSVMAYAVSQRMHEFGVRMALGATVGDILRLTIRQGGTLTVVGVGIGVLLALAFGSLMAGAMFGVIALDLMTILVASVGLGLAALAATCVPARRVLGLDPAKILRG